jgi:hypothetical protein
MDDSQKRQGMHTKLLWANLLENVQLEARGRTEIRWREENTWKNKSTKKQGIKTKSKDVVWEDVGLNYLTQNKRR